MQDVLAVVTMTKLYMVLLHCSCSAFEHDGLTTKTLSMIHLGKLVGHGLHWPAIRHRGTHEVGICACRCEPTELPDIRQAACHVVCCHLAADACIDHLHQKDALRLLLCALKPSNSSVRMYCIVTATMSH